MTDSPNLVIVRGYISAWNRHDGEGVAGTFLPQGVYRDPNVPGGVAGTALVTYVQALAAAFPDLTFEETFAASATEAVTVLQWIMRGTNTGAIMGRPPTGASIALPGIDLFRLEDGAIASVDGFFDRRALLEQLGLQVVVNPPSIPPVAFGSSSHVTAEKADLPGALSLTMIEVRGEEELMRVRVGAARIAPGLPRMAGFLGFLGGAIGRRLYTVTAWEHAEQARQVRSDPVHAEMVRQVFNGEMGVAMHTSTWVLHDLGRFWLRCPVCDQFRDIRTESQCRCGTEPSNAPPFW